MASPPLKNSVGFQLVQTTKIHRQRLGAALEELGLHVGQELVLIELAASGELGQSELVDRLGVEPPTVTKTLRKLEDSGLVERFEDPDDARAQRVDLTPEGDERIDDIEAIWNDVETTMLNGLTDEERLLLRRLLRHLHGNLDELDEVK